MNCLFVFNSDLCFRESGTFVLFNFLVANVFHIYDLFLRLLELSLFDVFFVHVSRFSRANQIITVEFFVV